MQVAGTDSGPACLAFSSTLALLATVESQDFCHLANPQIGWSVDLVHQVATLGLRASLRL
ncbi:hypothetical protein NOR_02788 [Metarhizium rileyi]|uniref:Uncharacterized protein n=1 Tax=Metarhizium rileyi (strain RCEF 4871) TaxID=1649241 RepID=A0A167GVF7_METRR|nr:hypothetical protein NOR_02788 [Metarhizium rileyi RCEF 4871]